MYPIIEYKINKYTLLCSGSNPEFVCCGPGVSGNVIHLKSWYFFKAFGVKLKEVTVLLLSERPIIDIRGSLLQMTHCFLALPLVDQQPQLCALCIYRDKQLSSKENSYKEQEITFDLFLI